MVERIDRKVGEGGGNRCEHSVLTMYLKLMKNR